MNEDVLIAKNITVEYKIKQGLFNSFTHKALDNVSFSIKKGEVLGVLGRNGSGKSTLLKILSGVMSPDSGEVIIPKGITRSLLTLGLGFNSDLTGRDNVILSAMFNGYSKKEAKLVSEEIKEFSELGEFYEQPVKTYSSGMRSKLGFSSAMLTNVDILMIDEVLAVGDKHFRKKAEEALAKKVKSDEQTVLFVSHSESQIERICSRSIDLSNNLKETLYNTEIDTPKIDEHESLDSKNVTNFSRRGIPFKIVKMIMNQNYSSISEEIGERPNLLVNVADLLKSTNINLAEELYKKAIHIEGDSDILKKRLKRLNKDTL